ncbi:EthD domain-containing protein [Candidatus Desantisbacteria bacterium]|nr:EthD domain-containing protein [Candidatus Desantisbacteria bacterium]
MIHQIIFAGPKPEMSVKEFQDYWVLNHAVNYASKIKQIKKYMIDTRIPFALDMGNPILPHQGVAEIWLENEIEQLASLRSKEFLQGARLDEPNWAAFWMTFVLDTTAHVIIDGPVLTKNPTWVKILILLKRKAGIPLQTFRDYSLAVHAPVVKEIPGLKRYMQCHTRDGHYVFGEASFDSVEQLWFDNTEALNKGITSEQFRIKVKASLENFVETKYVFSLAAKENWIIGPEQR